MVKRIVFMALVFGGLLSAPQFARAEEGCTTTLLHCYEAAAKIDNFWYRWAAGIDCELEYAGCVREVLLSE